MMTSLFLEISNGYWLFLMQYLEIHYIQGSALILLLGYVSTISISSNIFKNHILVQQYPPKPKSNGRHN